jgi:hypothetical protein
LFPLGALRLSAGSETFIAGVGEVMHRSLEIGHPRDHACTGRCPDPLCAVDLIAKDEQESEELHCPNPHASGHPVIHPEKHCSFSMESPWPVGNRGGSTPQT